MEIKEQSGRPSRQLPDGPSTGRPSRRASGQSSTSGTSGTSGQSPNSRRTASPTNLKVTKKEGDYIYVNSETKDPYEYRYDNEMKHWQTKRIINPNWITVKPSSGQAHKDADDSIRKRYDKIVNDYIAKNLSDSGQPPIATNTDNGVSSGGQTAGVSTGTESGVDTGVTSSSSGTNTTQGTTGPRKLKIKLADDPYYNWDEIYKTNIR